MVPMSQKKPFRDLYQETIKDHIYYQVFETKAKISLKEGRPYDPPRKFTFPFMDIFFYNVNETHLNCRHQRPSLPKEMVFPLRMRPLNRKLYFAPHNPHTYVLGNGLSTVDCHTGSFNHSMDRWRPRRDVTLIPCENLNDSHPFVKHTESPDGKWCQETLMMGGKILNTFNWTKDGDISKC